MACSLRLWAAIGEVGTVRAAYFIRREQAPALADDLANTELSELAHMRVDCDVDGLQMPQLIEPQPFGVRHFEHQSVAVGRLPALLSLMPQ